MDPRKIGQTVLMEVKISISNEAWTTTIVVPIGSLMERAHRPNQSPVVPRDNSAEMLVFIRSELRKVDLPKIRKVIGLEPIECSDCVYSAALRYFQ